MLLPSPPPHPAGLSAVLSHSAEPWVMAPACECRLEGVGCSVGPVAMIQYAFPTCVVSYKQPHGPYSSASPQPSHRPVSSCTPTSHTQQRSTGRRPEKTRTDLRSTREHQGGSPHLTLCSARHWLLPHSYAPLNIATHVQYRCPGVLPAPPRKRACGWRPSFPPPGITEHPLASAWHVLVLRVTV